MLSDETGSSPNRSAEEIAFAPWYLLLSNEADVGAIFVVLLEEDKQNDSDHRKPVAGHHPFGRALFFCEAGHIVLKNRIKH